MIYVGGIDFGLRHDWTAAVILAFADVPPERGVWMPHIVALKKMRADTISTGSTATMLDVVESMCVTMLDHFDITLLLGDSTHDEGSVAWLARRYGEGRVEGMNFGGNAMNSLWHDTLHFVGAPEGFPWMDPSALPPGSELRRNAAELQEQITVEQTTVNGRGQQSFYHPGEHNDLLHGFNLSCVAARRVQNAVSHIHGEIHVMPAQGSIPYRQDPRMVPEGMGGYRRRSW